MITDIAAGEKVGTRFRPLEVIHEQFQALAEIRPAQQRRHRGRRRRGDALCASAARACCPRGSSRVEGHFAAGEAVDVFFRKDGRRLVGKGITNFSADELRRIKGMQSRQVMKLLPHGEEEVIHRDYFVLAD